MKQHLQSQHMLPKKRSNGKSTNIKWKIVKPDENGKIKCLNCPQKFNNMHYAKIHQYKCFKPLGRRFHFEARNSFEVSHELEKLENGWVVCLGCRKTFLSMENAECHLKNVEGD